ncbi:MAG: DUF4367 domain-containing protein [Roseiflexaceae bacterium]|nr:DUF4367 domain-containing protein [Roseiflexaceae bacterium]
MNTHYRSRPLKLLAILAILACAACANNRATAPTAVRPTPTIAAAVIATQPAAESTPDLIVAPAVPQPATAPATATQAPAPQPAAPVAFDYLWPAYLPDGMAISANESRVAQENEIGTTGAGFYLVTWNGGERKLVVGGGASDALPLAGEQRTIDFRNAEATITSSGEQRQLVFSRDGAKFFVYSRKIAEDELLLVADSLVPMEASLVREQLRGS